MITILQTVSAFYIMIVFVATSVALLGLLWDDEKPEVSVNGPKAALLLVATLVCAITTLGAV